MRIEPGALQSISRSSLIFSSAVVVAMVGWLLAGKARHVSIRRVTRALLVAVFVFASAVTVFFLPAVSYLVTLGGIFIFLFGVFVLLERRTGQPGIKATFPWLLMAFVTSFILMFANLIGSSAFHDANGELWVIDRYVPTIKISDGMQRMYTRNSYGYFGPEKSYVIPPVFYLAMDFSEGLAAVKRHKGDLYEYINKKGEAAIPPSFTDAHEFSSGLASVYRPGSFLYEYINDKGETVIPAKFGVALPFKGQYAWVQTGQWGGCIDKRGNFVDGPKLLTEKDLRQSNKSEACREKSEIKN